MNFILKPLKVVKFFAFLSLPFFVFFLSDNFINQNQKELLKFSVSSFITILTFLSGILLIILSLKYDTKNASNSKKNLLKIKLKQRNNFIVFLFFIYLFTLIMLSLILYFPAFFVKVVFVLLAYTVILSFKLIYLIKEYCEMEN